MPLDVGLINPMGLAGEAANYSRMFPDYANLELQRRQLALQGQQEQRLNAENQTKAGRLAQYQQELVELEKNPTTDAVSRFMMRWPEFANENKAAYDIGEEGRKSANTERVGGIVHAMETNPDLAIQLLHETVSAEAAAGKEPDKIMQAMIEDFESGDDIRRKRAIATGKVILARTIGPKEFAERLGAGKPGETKQTIMDLEEVAPGLGAQYAKTKAAGQLQTAYQPGTQNVIGAYSLSSLPRVDQPGGGAGAQPPPPQQPVTVTSAGGTPVQRQGVDDATGLTKVTSAAWAPGTFAYLTHSKQEYAKVPSGAQFYAPDGKLYVKP